jgi:hypothetical protein
MDLPFLVAKNLEFSDFLWLRKISESKLMQKSYLFMKKFANVNKIPFPICIKWNYVNSPQTCMVDLLRKQLVGMGEGGMQFLLC